MLITDIVVVYTVSPSPDATETNISAVIEALIDHVQNHDVSFIKEPGFIHDVLVFIIIGDGPDHTYMANTLSHVLKESGCQLTTIAKGMK